MDLYSHFNTLSRCMKNSGWMSYRKKYFIQQVLHVLNVCHTVFGRLAVIDYPRKTALTIVKGITYQIKLIPLFPAGERESGRFPQNFYARVMICYCSISFQTKWAIVIINMIQIHLVFQQTHLNGISHTSTTHTCNTYPYILHIPQTIEACHK